MNVPFTLKDSSLDELFLKGAAERGMVQAEGAPFCRRHARVDLQPRCRWREYRGSSST